MANRPLGALSLSPVLALSAGTGCQADSPQRVAVTGIFDTFSFLLLCCGMCWEGIAHRLSSAPGQQEDFCPLLCLGKGGKIAGLHVNSNCANLAEILLLLTDFSKSYSANKGCDKNSSCLQKTFNPSNGLFPVALQGKGIEAARLFEMDIKQV